MNQLQRLMSAPVFVSSIFLLDERKLHLRLKDQQEAGSKAEALTCIIYILGLEYSEVQFKQML